MGYTLPLFLGFVTASAGITPPGLINMTAAKVSVNEGRTRALIFAGGATAVVLLQTYLALVFAKFIDRNPDIVVLIREIGLASLVGLTAFILWRAQHAPPVKELKLHSKRSRFFLGMLLSALNFFPIPFFVFVSITLSSYGYFQFRSDIPAFVLGAGIGAYFGFYCYIAFFKKLEDRTRFILRNMNYIIGSITGLVSLVTLYNIIEYYWL